MKQKKYIFGANQQNDKKSQNHAKMMCRTFISDYGENISRIIFPNGIINFHCLNPEYKSKQNHSRILKLINKNRDKKMTSAEKQYKQGIDGEKIETGISFLLPAKISLLKKRVIKIVERKESIMGEEDLSVCAEIGGLSEDKKVQTVQIYEQIQCQADKKPFVSNNPNILESKSLPQSQEQLPFSIHKSNMIKNQQKIDHKRRAEKRYSDYLCQQARNTLKSLSQKQILQKLNKHKTSCKSKKYFMIILGYVRKEKKEIREKFVREIGGRIEKRLKKIEKKEEKKEGDEVYLEIMKRNFENSVRSIHEFFEGEIEKSFTSMFGGGRSCQKMHQKTYSGFSEAIRLFQQEFSREKAS